ncbi:MAG: nitroreductase family protein [Ruminococcus sp.]|jgi:nitroreductase
MNAVIENLLTRRSVRSFQNKPISDADLEMILQTAIYAPSGMGKQTWKFTAVTDRAKIQRLAAAISQELGRENYDMYNPEVLIIPSNERDSKWGKEDNACALENIFLAAHSLGIGSVWINQLQGICDVPAIRAVLDEFNIPADHIVYGMAALGYPADAPAKKVSKKGEIQIIR